MENRCFRRRFWRRRLLRTDWAGRRLPSPPPEALTAAATSCRPPGSPGSTLSPVRSWSYRDGHRSSPKLQRLLTVQPQHPRPADAPGGPRRAHRHPTEHQAKIFCFLRVKCQTPRESGFARALRAQHPATRSDRSTRVCRKNGARTDFHERDEFVSCMLAPAALT